MDRAYHRSSVAAIQNQITEIDHEVGQKNQYNPVDRTTSLSETESPRSITDRVIRTPFLLRFTSARKIFVQVLLQLKRISAEELSFVDSILHFCLIFFLYTRFTKTRSFPQTRSFSGAQWTSLQKIFKTSTIN